MSERRWAVPPARGLEFAAESDLGAAIVQHWDSTPLGSRYRLVREKFESIQTKTGTVDLVAVSEERRELLVMEVKRKNASHRKLGQLLRYMGDLAQDWTNYTVRGAIIAQACKSDLQVALVAVPTVEFYRVDSPFRLTRQVLPEAPLPSGAFMMREELAKGIENTPLVANWNSTPWGETHSVLEARFEAGRGKDPLHVQVVAKAKKKEQLVVVYASGDQESFPFVSKIVLRMGELMMRAPSMEVIGAVIVRKALPRLRAAVRAMPGVECYSLKPPFSLHREG